MGTLPQDISKKPHLHSAQEEDQDKLKVLIKEIESLINTEKCNNAADWKFAPIGSKPCGGPSSYIAYPQQLETEILSKISLFTAMQSDYNLKYNLTSDCAMVLPPVEIKCENGKAVLISATATDEL